MKKILLCFLILFPLLAFAQKLRIPQDPHELEGKWAGKLLQDNGGLSTAYYFELEIHLLKDGAVQGVSYIQYEEWYGKISFNGTFNNGKVYFKETKIVQQHLNRGQWCIKNMHLQLHQLDNGLWELKGTWDGEIEGGMTCPPGHIVVHKMLNA